MRTATELGPSPAPSREVSALFDRLDVLHVLLSENTDRWSVSTGGAVIERILDERAALQAECATVERALLVLTAVSEGPGTGFHAHRRRDTYEAAAAVHAAAAAMHDRAAAVHAAAGRPELAAKEHELAVRSERRQREALTRAQSYAVDGCSGAGRLPAQH